MALAWGLYLKQNNYFGMSAGEKLLESLQGESPCQIQQKFNRTSFKQTFSKSCSERGIIFLHLFTDIWTALIDAEQLWNIWAPASASTFISLCSYNKQQRFGLECVWKFFSIFVWHKTVFWKSVYMTVMASEQVYLYYTTDSESESDEGDDNSK